MSTKLLMRSFAALALASGLLLAGAADAQDNAQSAGPGTTSGPASGTSTTLPATRHQSEVLRSNPPVPPVSKTPPTGEKPATVHQSQVLRNLKDKPTR